MTAQARRTQNEIQSIVRGDNISPREPANKDNISDTERFCRAILPSQGHLCLQPFVDGRPTMAEWFTSPADLARRAMEYPDPGTVDLYVSIASFRAPGNEHGKNVAHKRALCIDVDVGPGKPYSSLDAATEDLARLCRERNIPAPGIVVASVHGLHLYWPLSMDVSEALWEEMACDLKAACDLSWFHAGSQVNADVAGLLRIPGTQNRKDTALPVPVEMAFEGRTFDVEDLRAVLRAAATRPTTTTCLIGNPEDLKASVYPNTSWFDDLPEDQRLLNLGQMLKALPDSAADDYGEWTRTLAEIASANSVPWEALVDAAFDFSRRSTKSTRENRDTIAEKMRGLGNRTNISALRNRAEQYGYRRPGLPDSALYADETTATAGLAARYAYVADVDMYMDLTRRQLISKPTLKEIESWRMPKTLFGRLADPVTLLRNSPQTQRCSSVGFHPGAGATFTEDGALLANLFHHDAPDPIRPTRVELRQLARFLRHMFPRGSDLVWLKHLLDTYAYLLQNPGERVSFTMILVGAIEGSGKSTLMEAIPRLLFGEHNVITASNHELASDFTDYLARAWIVVYAEIALGRDRDATRIANNLKDNQTNRILRIVEKNRAGRSIRNRTTFLATSNDETHALQISQFDRRSGVCATSAKSMPTALSTPLYAFLNSQRAAGVLRQLLLSRDVTQFNPAAAPPATDAKAKLIEHSREPIHAELVEAWQMRDAPFDRDFGSIESVRMCLFGRNIDVRNLSDKRLGDLLRRPPISAAKFDHQRRIVSGKLNMNKRVRLWVWRDSDTWMQMPDSVLRRHLESGGPPLEAISTAAQDPKGPTRANEPTTDAASIGPDSAPSNLRGDCESSSELDDFAGVNRFQEGQVP